MPTIEASPHDPGGPTPATGGLDHPTRITITGEFDVTSAPELDRTLRRVEPHAPLIVLDLRGLEHIDCAGAEALLAAARRIGRGGGRLVVARARAEVRWFFALIGLDGQIEIADGISAQRPLAQPFATGAP